MSYEVDDARIDELLDRWEDCDESGERLTVEDLCRECPELLSEVQRRLRLLSATQWMADGDSSLTIPDDRSENYGTGTLPGSGSTRTFRRTQPGPELTIDEFLSSLCSSGLMSDSALGQLRQFETATSNADSIAESLVEQGVLTGWQASVILDQRPDPLLVDRYTILDVLGSGGMGVVFKALHKSMDRVVALKMLPPELVDSQDKVTRFKREMKAAARLSHPNVVTVFDASETDGSHFLAMEYVRGSNLADDVRSHGPMQVSQAVESLRQAAKGLQHAHENGIIHRDVKPGNLMVDEEGTVKVTDLGLAVLESDSDSLQASVEPESSKVNSGERDLTGEMILGTVAYSSPEQASDTSQADARSDIYSLGATLYYILAGQPPYSEKTPVKTMLAHQNQPIPSLRSIRGDVPQELDDVLSRMLAKQPDDRFQTMSDVDLALSRVPVDPDALVPNLTVVDVDADTHPVMAHHDATEEWARPDTATSEKAGRPQSKVGVLLRAAGALTLLAGIIIIISSRDTKTRFELSASNFADIHVDTGDGGADNDGAMTISISPESSKAEEEADSANRAKIEIEAPPKLSPLVDSGQLLGKSTSTHVELGDFDGDGDVDAMVTNQKQPNTVWLNGGTGHFADSGQRLGESDSRRFALADLDNDDDLDAFICNYQDQPNRVWLNDGNGSFESNGQELGMSNSRDVALRDFDGDGDIDAFVANKGRPNTVWMNDGSGKFSDTGQALGEYDSRGLDSGDLDDDGDIDVFVVNGGDDFTADPNRVWLNQGDGTFRDSGRTFGDNWSLAVQLGDLDGDGDLDAFVANTIGRPANTVWLNDGSGRFFDSGQQLGEFHSQNILLRDLDNDGDLDAFVSNVQASQVWINDGMAVFGDHFYPGGGSAMASALADFDGDGNLDTFAANVGRVPNRVLFGHTKIERQPNTIRIQVSSTVNAETIEKSDSGEQQTSPAEISIDQRAARPHPDAAPGEPYTNAVGMKLAWVERGNFPMGGGSENDETINTLVAQDFYIGIHEVTQGEWQEVMGDNPSYFAPTGEGAAEVSEFTDDELRAFPVENVNWYDSLEFTRKLTKKLKPAAGWEYRMPTETEWEYACRGGGGHDIDHYNHDFYFDKPLDSLSQKLANHGGIDRTTSVDSYMPNSLGIHSMHGNVREWCLDLIYLSPRNANRPRRSSRGGAWLQRRSSAGDRGYLSARDRHGAYGLRIVLGREVDVPQQVVHETLAP